MKRCLFLPLLVVLILLGFTPGAMAQDAKVLCFEKKTGDEEERGIL